jgi:hypothetical protein
MSELYTELECVLATLPPSLLATLAESFTIHHPERLEEAEIVEYRTRELSYVIVEREVVGATLCGIYDELAGFEFAAEYFAAFKNALTDRLVIRLKRAEEAMNSSTSST